MREPFQVSNYLETYIYVEEGENRGNMFFFFYYRMKNVLKG